MYISLYRRYRPQTFSDVVGQSAAIGVVTRAIENGTVGHAYLFSGPRGCGKTTIARLFAKSVNCPHRNGAEPCNECETCRSIVEGSCLDVIEIDGASNNSVDEIRDLKEHVALASFTCPYKVYIIDEVHMLSVSAFNALLKTLEEPPERVIFILATTAPHKVPVTIRSRCQHIPFHGMTPQQIVSRLEHVAETERLHVQNEALWEIARNSEGGMRDALSLMEQAVSFGTGDISRETIDKLLGGGSASSIRSWISMCRTEPAETLPRLEDLFRSGAVPERFLSVLFTSIRNLWLQSRWGGKVLDSLMLSEEERGWLAGEKDSFSTTHLERLMALISSLLPQVRRGISNDVLCGLLVNWLLTTNPVCEIDDFTPSPPKTSVDKTYSTIPSPAVKTAVTPISFRSAAPDRDFSQQAPDDRQVSPEKQSRNLDKQNDTDNLQVPKIDGLVQLNDDLSIKLKKELERVPHVASPLLIADILFDEQRGVIQLQYDPSDFLSYENIRDERIRRELFHLLTPERKTLNAIEVFCGEHSENLLGEIDNQLPGLSGTPSHIAKQDELSNEVHTSPQLKETPDVQVKKDDFHSRAADDKTERTSTSLSDYLRTFMEGSLLYCRRNEESAVSADEDDE